VKGNLSLSWGSWGGFYVYRGRGALSTYRLCCGWLAVTYIGGLEIDDLMEGFWAGGEK
jgi:hypothetical protein